MRKQVIWKLLLVLCTLVCLCAVIGASAESLDEWNRACRVKTAGQTSVYALSDSNCAGTPVATLPMGTYCKTVSTQEGIWLISYMLENGQKGSGFALQWDFEPAVVTYVDSRGEEATMQELKWLDLFGSIPEYNDAGEEPVTLPGEETAAAPVQTASAPSRDPIVIYEAYLSDDSGIVTLYRYGFAQVSGQVESGCPVRVTDLQEQGYVFVQYDGGSGWVTQDKISRELPENAVVYPEDEPEVQEQVSEPAVTAQPVQIAEPEAAPETETTVEPEPETADGPAVQPEKESKAYLDVSAGGQLSIVTLGAYSCVVDTASGRGEMLTKDMLSFFGEDAILAVVNAPRTGKAALRDKASKQSKTLQDCAAGKLVLVLESGNDFSKVLIDGREGYIRNSSLRFVSTLIHEPFTVVLSRQGKTDGRDKINIRCTPDRDSAAVAVWPTGTAATLISHTGSWYEIEYDGIRGYVMDTFVVP